MKLADQMLDMLSPSTRVNVLAQVAKDEESAKERRKLDTHLSQVKAARVKS